MIVSNPEKSAKAPAKGGQPQKGTPGKAGKPGTQAKTVLPQAQKGSKKTPVEALVAISNNRLLSFNDDRVTFTWKDYQHGAAKKTMTLTADEFIRRFLLHIPPAGFQHIRHYGFLANRYRETKLAHCRELLQLPPPIVEPSASPQDYRDQYQKLTGQSLRDCPRCGKGHMLVTETIPAASLSRARPPDTS